MKKKILAFSLAALVGCTSMLVGCNNSNKAPDASSKAPSSQTSGGSTDQTRTPGQLPLSEEKVTLKFASVRGPLNTVPYSEMPVIKSFEKESNVTIEWEEIERAAIQEKVNLMFSSNQLPDAFYGPLLTDAQVITFSKNKSLIPLNGLIEAQAPNVSKTIKNREDYRKSITTQDGNIYALATMFEEERTLSSANLFINKAWLDKLGLGIPQTSDEFYEALKAFKDKDANGNGKKDEIPFTTFDNGVDGYSIYSLFGMFGQPNNATHLAVKDNKVIYTAVQDNYKEAIKYFNKLYSDGLIDPEIFTQDASQVKAKGNNSTEIVGSVMSFWLDDVIAKEKQSDYVHVLPMKGPNGDQKWGRELYMTGLSKNTFAITSACKNSEVAMRWVDYWMDNNDKSITVTQGEKDALWGYVDEAQGTWKSYNDKAPEGMTYGQWRHSNCPGSVGVYTLFSDITGKRVLDEANQAQQTRYENKKPYLMPAESVIPTMYFDLEDQQIVSTVQNDILTFANQKRAEWITKGGIDQEWDAYLKQMEQYGLSKMLEAYQRAYDSFIKQ